VLVVKHAVNGRDASLPLAAIAKTRSAVRHDRGGRNLAGIRLIAEIALRARQMETSRRLNQLVLAYRVNSMRTSGWR
jgi:hypothetical protein